MFQWFLRDQHQRDLRGRLNVLDQDGHVDGDQYSHLDRDEQ
jgi:hypothetical protein